MFFKLDLLSKAVLLLALTQAVVSTPASLQARVGESPQLTDWHIHRVVPGSESEPLLWLLTKLCGAAVEVVLLGCGLVPVRCFKAKEYRAGATYLVAEQDPEIYSHTSGCFRITVGSLPWTRLKDNGKELGCKCTRRLPFVHKPARTDHRMGHLSQGSAA
ncbi:hypothetical protein FB45DRAFT_872585 [Roridomyces roridus]|uniref:Uncharacterized protein n=1 Tax=Roridomyces roridus TaxID=1738132 RepID=A0AAD7BD52_9AGAR|nr:hypothetical protein FB45DRAFT_872585 [Roridomyces roridus]